MPLVFAGDIVINEFLVDPEASQWVELYNKGSASRDISGWFIDDSGRSQKFTIPSGTVINPLEYKIFESSLFNLNRSSADTIRLLNGSVEEDSYSYNNGPGENYTFGRDVDGAGSWVAFSFPTKGSANSSSTPLPTATIVPTATLTPTKTPSPTTPPTPTKTPTPIKTPTPTKIPTPIKEKSESTPTSSSKAVLAANDKASSKTPTPDRDVPTAVLGKKTEAVTPTVFATPSPILDKKTKVRGSRGIHPFFIVIGSLLVLSCAILVFFRIGRSKNFDA